MKREVVFLGIWSFIAIVTLFVCNILETFMNNELLHGTGSLGLGFRLFRLNGVQFLSILILGLIVGVLGINYRFISRLGRIFLIILGVYFTIMYPAYNLYGKIGIIYPKWLLMSSFSTNLGILMLSVVILVSFKDKISFLKKSNLDN